MEASHHVAQQRMMLILFHLQDLAPRKVYEDLKLKSHEDGTEYQGLLIKVLLDSK